MSSDSRWYKDAIVYQLHVRAFHDANADGIGDFQGLTEKLDYLQDLGVTALWLLPFYPSPLRDDGYDIADYTDVHPAYGTLRDFRIFLAEAHRRDLRVITELVVNHTSDQHPWFQRARQSPPGSRAREFYVWSDTPDRYRDARIIFKDFEPSNWSWDPVAGAYYWHRFFSHQPDLNFDNPEVRRAILKNLDFWLEMGVDGVRLDAVPYLYEREGTSCENLPETHAFLKELRRHVDETYEHRMLLAEANQWPEDAVSYFGDGDECHMAFHFPVMPRLFMAIHMEDRYPIVDILEQTPAIPDSSQWALFLRNHDELTLEMVTDEDRDYMYRVYAHDPRARINLGIRRRLAPLLGNNRRKIELLKSLLLSLPGTPVVYYGDEIGMGDNIYLGDRNGVRTPMQWSADRNAGFSRSNPQKLFLPIIIDPEYHYEAINVEAQQHNPSSLLWWDKRIIALRKQHPAFGRGSIEFLAPENRKVLVFLRRWQHEQILVVVNLSRFVQCVELDLSEFEGLVPVEIFGRTRFPPIGELPYFLTLGPHTFYWFILERSTAEARLPAAEEPELPALPVAGRWENLLETDAVDELGRVLPGYLKPRRWFAAKARQIIATRVIESIALPSNGATLAYLTLVEASYSEGGPEVYLLPLAFTEAAEPDEMSWRVPQHTRVARLQVRRDDGEVVEGYLHDALAEEAVPSALLDSIARRRRLKGARGELQGLRTRAFRKARGPTDVELEPSLLKAEQSNTSVIYGERLILKLFRRVDRGVNPDLEIGRFLTERTSFEYLPAVAGALEYRQPDSEPMTLGLLQAFVPNEGDAWRYTLDMLDDYFEHALARHREVRELPIPPERPLDLVAGDIPHIAHELIGAYLESARLLGKRTAELHVALASRDDVPEFAPEPFTPLYRRSLYQSMRSHADQMLTLLRRRAHELPEDVRDDAELVLGMRDRLIGHMHALVDTRISALRIRCHGDYHLGQVLYTGRDFVIMDFEGEPSRPISERRLKRSPLRDVAGMLRSFHYAAISALVAGGVRPEDIPVLEPWAQFWYRWVVVGFLKAYLDVASEADFLPEGRAELGLLLDLYLMEKALYELGYELNNRPDWVRIPLLGIGALVETSLSR